MVNIWRRQPSNRFKSYSLIKHRSYDHVEIGNQFWEVSGEAPTYFGILKRWTGSIWIKEILKVYIGSSWQTKALKRWDGSQWMLVDTTGI